MLSIWTSLKFCHLINDTIPSFNNPDEKIMKTLWKKEKMLVTSTFSFIPNVFYLNNNRSHLVIYFYHYFVFIKSYWVVVHCGVRGREVECRPRNHRVPSLSPGSGSQLWDFSLAHTFGASTGVVPRKQYREGLV